ncbi:MAG: hypothetical protein GY714_17695 [Desulfobacterales bacterium]|nr:hypothetical protein [Desulfobacterales bacterium]MCP4163796.1 hypothetical protein [Deltaproteobacteria bacterium]
MDLENSKIKSYNFLEDMYRDSYFPDFLVDKGKEILLKLCSLIEETNPKDDALIYKLTHAATEKFNDLNHEFGENGSEIETAARDCIGMDFDFIVKSYGFDLDIEEVIAPRDW